MQSARPSPNSGSSGVRGERAPCWHCKQPNPDHRGPDCPQHPSRRSGSTAAASSSPTFYAYEQGPGVGHSRVPARAREPARAPIRTPAKPYYIVYSPADVRGIYGGEHTAVARKIGLSGARLFFKREEDEQAAAGYWRWKLPLLPVPPVVDC